MTNDEHVFLSLRPTRCVNPTLVAALLTLLGIAGCSDNAQLGGKLGTTAGNGNGNGNGNGGNETAGVAFGASGSGGGNTCNDHSCERNLQCVTACGGPVIQDSCCECPLGSFDSYECQPGTGGSTGLGGAAGAGGLTSLVECKADTDCYLSEDCCGCRALSRNGGETCTTTCALPQTCSNLQPTPKVLCSHGQCVLDRRCNSKVARCDLAPEACAPGQLHSLTMDGFCFGDCIDIGDCSEVSACDVCKQNGLMCVYDHGVFGVAHCVEAPASCAAASLCSCFGGLCGGVEPCVDIDGGIACGGG
ncbi:MAG TPA: hypothetical protein VIV60_29240 [Polyangiaceae bacterium]